MPWLITYKKNGEAQTRTDAIKETPVEWIVQNYGLGTAYFNVSLIYAYQISDEEYTLLTAGK